MSSNPKEAFLPAEPRLLCHRCKGRPKVRGYDYCSPCNRVIENQYLEDYRFDIALNKKKAKKADLKAKYLKEANQNKEDSEETLRESEKNLKQVEVNVGKRTKQKGDQRQARPRDESKETKPEKNQKKIKTSDYVIDQAEEGEPSDDEMSEDDQETLKGGKKGKGKKITGSLEADPNNAQAQSNATHPAQSNAPPLGSTQAQSNATHPAQSNAPPLGSTQAQSNVPPLGSTQAQSNAPPPGPEFPQSKATQPGPEQGPPDASSNQGQAPSKENYFEEVSLEGLCISSSDPSPVAPLLCALCFNITYPDATDFGTAGCAHPVHKICFDNPDRETTLCLECKTPYGLFIPFPQPAKQQFQRLRQKTDNIQ